MAKWVYLFEEGSADMRNSQITLGQALDCWKMYPPLAVVPTARMTS